VRWRVSAAGIDNLIVNLIYVGLCALLHWRVASLGHLWLLVVAGVAYHFVLEARDGQTIGKRRYGIRVVGMDGGNATTRAVAIRSALRVVDQLPVWYVSGLISMVRTGPARRQRIGDIAAGTMVVAVGGRAARRGTPGWMLPAATLFAVAVSAFYALAIAEAGTQPLNFVQQQQFIAGCENSPVGGMVDCGCFLNRLEADGYDTPDALNNLVSQADSEAAAGTSGRSRTALESALVGCRR
jgi:uncharacterized RDD family membrane protein YckC